MKKLSIITIISLLMLSLGCASVNDASRSLVAEGYSNPNAGGYSVLGCGFRFYHTKFTATVPNGDTVRGVVCSGRVYKNSVVVVY